MTGPATPSARQAPRISVVLPAPTSPRGRRRRRAEPLGEAGADRFGRRRRGVSTLCLSRRCRAARSGGGARPAASAAAASPRPPRQPAPGRRAGPGSCEVAAQRFLHRRRPQRRRRVQQRQQEDRPAAELVQLRRPAHAGDPDLAAGQQLGREVAERADDPRLDQPHLLEQVGLAGLDLGRLRVAVAGRPRLQHVGDEDLLAREADLLQQLVQQLPGATDERQPLAVLFGARRLTDEHQVGGGVAGAEHGLGPRLVQRAPGAVLDLLVQRDQALAALLRSQVHGFSPAARRLRDSAIRSPRAASRSRRRDSSERTPAPRG